MNKDCLNHNDCRNFIPVDAAKGICSVNKTEILIDGPTCPKFETLPKCKNCSNFTDQDDKAMGICAGFKDKYWTFGDLKAVTCEGYQAK